MIRNYLCGPILFEFFMAARVVRSSGILRLWASFFVFFLLLLSTTSQSHGSSGWTREQQQQFRKLYALSDAQAEILRSLTRQSILLPPGTGYDQRASMLCWVYATFNAIESNWLYKDPNMNIALSRNAMQRISNEDRYVRLIKGLDNITREGGTAVDAIQLVLGFGYSRNSGIYSYTDGPAYPIYPNWYNSLDFIGVGTEAEQLYQLYSLVDHTYAPLSSSTHDFQGGEINPVDFAAQVLANDTHWTAYGIADETHPDGTIGIHFDPDRRAGTQATYLDKSKMGRLIFESLRRGHALVVSWLFRGHDEAIYGADFDENNEPLVIYIKGSYGPDYLYKMSFESLSSLFSAGVGFTTMDLPMAM